MATAICIMSSAHAGSPRQLGDVSSFPIVFHKARSNKLGDHCVPGQALRRPHVGISLPSPGCSMHRKVDLSISAFRSIKSGHCQRVEVVNFRSPEQPPHGTSVSGSDQRDGTSADTSRFIQRKAVAQCNTTTWGRSVIILRQEIVRNDYKMFGGHIPVISTDAPTLTILRFILSL